MKENKQTFIELDDDDWLSKLMFFTYFSLYPKELNIKLQEPGKTIYEAFEIEMAFERKQYIYRRYLMNEEFLYFKKLNIFYADVSIDDIIVRESHMSLFIGVIDEILEQFSSDFLNSEISNKQQNL